MKTVGQVVRDVLIEAGYASEQSGAGFSIAAPDGKRYKAEPTRVRKWLINNTRMTGDEREQVMSSGEVTAGVLDRMKRDRVVRATNDVPAARSPSRSRDMLGSSLGAARRKADKEYAAAVKRYSRQWSSDLEPDMNPEDVAHDAASGFFTDYADKWREWARLLDMHKSDMHGAVTDSVYDAMTKTRTKQGKRGSGQMKTTIGEIRRIVRSAVNEIGTRAATDPSAAILRLLKLPSDMRRVGDQLSWSKSGGYAGETVLKRVRAAAVAAGWQKGTRQQGNSPDGATIGSGDKYHDDAGNELTLRHSYGETKNSNRYSIELKLAR